MRWKAAAKLFDCTDASPPVMSAISCIDSIEFVLAACVTVVDVGFEYSADMSVPPTRPAAWIVYIVMSFAFAVLATD